MGEATIAVTGETFNACIAYWTLGTHALACCVEVYVCVYVCACVCCMYIMIKYVCVCVCCAFFFLFFFFTSLRFNDTIGVLLSVVLDLNI